MAQYIKIKKGLDIPLGGTASGRLETVEPQSVGICPDDFEGHVWKSAVKEGDDVAQGTPLFFDKATSRIKIVSPLKGRVKEIRRGERRKILVTVIESSPNDLPDAKYDTSIKEQAVRQTLQDSGLWAMMRQRPYDIVPQTGVTPRDIFVTAFDSSPLA